jgi:hypothetical protein
MRGEVTDEHMMEAFRTRYRTPCADLWADVLFNHAHQRFKIERLCKTGCHFGLFGRSLKVAARRHKHNGN